MRVYLAVCSLSFACGSDANDGAVEFITAIPSVQTCMRLCADNGQGPPVEKGFCMCSRPLDAGVPR
jgi:hypothetical protein